MKFSIKLQIIFIGFVCSIAAGFIFYSIVISQNHEYLQTGNLRNQIIIIGLIIIILGSALAILIAKLISTPIAGLVNVTKQISAGNLSARAEIKSKDEVGILADSFNEMTAKLDMAYKNLTRKNYDIERALLDINRTQSALLNISDDLNIKNKELETSEDYLRHLSERLERSNNELEQFAYVSSHDLQEPLRMVKSYMQLLEKRYKDKLDNDAQNYIRFAVDGANRMYNLINDLLAFSRVGTRSKPFVLTNFEKVIKEALNNLEAGIRESNAVINYDIQVQLMADESQMIQVFQNLIGNAVKYQRKGEIPRINVAAELQIVETGLKPVSTKEQHEWLFKIQDNGIGIEPQYYERIFVIFQRLHTREEYSGTGIGLAICKKIVERHGGKIWVESEPNKGSTFYFTIPEK